jgi:surface antigen
MRSLKTGTKVWLLGSTLLFSSPLLETANAAQPDQSNDPAVRPTASLQAHHLTRTTVAYSHAIPRTGSRLASRSYGMSCVPYARQVSGIDVAGNAWQWWYNAKGLYARGNRPEPASILNFRANPRMPLGHVAVVTRVVNDREVMVDQANWPSVWSGRGGVSHDVAVVDVSEANNWSAVRVELGRHGEFGSVYPTYGFIYGRPDTGLVIASIARPAPPPAINRVPSDLRPVAERPWHTVEEVAEAPSSSTPHRKIDLSVTSAPASFGR